jgi:hypothetical protein
MDQQEIPEIRETPAETDREVTGVLVAQLPIRAVLFGVLPLLVLTPFLGVSMVIRAE